MAFFENDDVYVQDIPKLLITQNSIDVSFESAKWSIDNGNEETRNEISQIILSYGTLDSFIWLFNETEAVDKEKICEVAVSCERLDIVKWLIINKGYLINGDLYRIAAERGFIEILEWLSENDDSDNFVFYFGLMVDAINYDRRNVLQWLFNRGVTKTILRRGCSVIICNGNLDLLIWTIEGMKIKPNLIRLRNEAEKRSRSEIVKWIDDKLFWEAFNYKVKMPWFF